MPALGPIQATGEEAPYMCMQYGAVLLEDNTDLDPSAL